ncbi:YpfJ protein, zinc metalloprotease superfamily protein [Minicystis rosea]|nr:YpfJ protein, zinc metalloprotease superfamily protein [Minicystis rosea]
MRWDPEHRSRDVIDRRGERGGGGVGAGRLLFLLPLLLRSKFGWLVLLALLGGWLLFGRGTSSVDTDEGRRVAPTEQVGQTGPADKQGAFVGFVLDDVQDTWSRVFNEKGLQYERAKLVLFDGMTPTACGHGSSATGPFYCPLDSRVYMDLGFFRELQQRLGAGGISQKLT